MAPAHAGRKCPRDLQILGVIGVDLIERAVARAGVVFGRHRPLAIIGLILNLPENGCACKNPQHQQVKPLSSESHVLVFVCRRTLDRA